MITWDPTVSVYLHRNPVDFRKSVNGLSVIVSEQMELNVYGESLFVFCNKTRDKLKVLYWDKTGFALWYKRLEKAKFKWPRKEPQAILTVNHEQWQWLLRGLNFYDIKPHQALYFTG